MACEILDYAQLIGWTLPSGSSMKGKPNYHQDQYFVWFTFKWSSLSHNFFGRVVIECGNNMCVNIYGLCLRCPKSLCLLHLLKRSHFPRMTLSKLFWKSDEQVVLFFLILQLMKDVWGTYIYVLSIAQDVTIASKVHKMLIFWLEDVLFFGHHKIRKSYS